MIGVLICAAILGVSAAVLALALAYASGYSAGYEQAQLDAAEQFIEAAQELIDLHNEPVSHIDYQRAAGKAGLQ